MQRACLEFEKQRCLSPDIAFNKYTLHTCLVWVVCASSLASDHILRHSASFEGGNATLVTRAKLGQKVQKPYVLQLLQTKQHVSILKSPTSVHLSIRDLIRQTIREPRSNQLTVWLQFGPMEGCPQGKLFHPLILLGLVSSCPTASFEIYVRHKLY